MIPFIYSNKAVSKEAAFFASNVCLCRNVNDQLEDRYSFILSSLIPENAQKDSIVTKLARFVFLIFAAIFLAVRDDFPVIFSISFVYNNIRSETCFIIFIFQRSRNGDLFSIQSGCLVVKHYEYFFQSLLPLYFC